MNYLHEAKGGSDEAATQMLVGLAWHLQQNSLSDAQRQFLSDALAAIADAPPGKRQNAAKTHLLLGRQPGAKPKYIVEKEELGWALYVWSIIGDVPDNELKAACQRASEQHRAAPDPNLLRRAYLKHRDALRRI